MSDVENTNVPVASEEANAVEPNVTMEVESNDASTEVVDSVEGDNAPVAEPVAPVTLNINTLVDVKKLLDVAIARGMVRPNEMTAVGTIYDRFVGGLNTLVQQSQAVESSAESN